MKSIKILFGLILIIVSTSSCKKKIYGCVDPLAENYSSVANEDAQNCTYAESPFQIFYSYDNEFEDIQDPYYSSFTVHCPLVTEEIMEKGLIIVHYRFNGNIWFSMNNTSNWQGNVEELAYEVKLGEIKVYQSKNGTSGPGYIFPMDLKIIIQH